MAAAYRDGFLLVTLPKKAIKKQQQTRLIPINAPDQEPVQETVTTTESEDTP